jgi:hypothetical protein
MNLCVNCKFIMCIDPVGGRSIEPVCTRPEFVMIDPVDGAVTWPLCSNQRKGPWKDPGERCGHEGKWFKAKEPGELPWGRPRCIDCRHARVFKEVERGIREAIEPSCAHPEFVKISPVDGRAEMLDLCKDQRKIGLLPTCGPIGRCFEPKGGPSNG